MPLFDETAIQCAFFIYLKSHPISSVASMPNNKYLELILYHVIYDPGLGTEHLPGALCSGTGSPALGLCSP